MRKDPDVPYTADVPQRPSAEELRARIPGWGADLDPADRPSVPREQFLPTGAHWTMPEDQARQPGQDERERSIEHGRLPPVYGTSVPLRGLSGVLRRHAYRTYSEARAAHWLLLLGADRVDAVESHLASLLSTRPDNPVTQTGVRSEVGHSPVRSRFGQNRADAGHHVIDPVLVAGPWVLAGAAAYGALRFVRRRAAAR